MFIPLLPIAASFALCALQLGLGYAPNFVPDKQNEAKKLRLASHEFEADIKFSCGISELSSLDIDFKTSAGPNIARRKLR